MTTLTMMERLHFTTRVLGTAAADRLENHQVTQTLRSENDSIVNAIINGRLSAGDRIEIVLDSTLVGEAELVSLDAVTGEALCLDDARRGGFETVVELFYALRRAGYRFKPLDEYVFHRCKFSWRDKR